MSRHATGLSYIPVHLGQACFSERVESVLIAPNTLALKACKLVYFKPLPYLPHLIEKISTLSENEWTRPKWRGIEQKTQWLV